MKTEEWYQSAFFVKRDEVIKLQVEIQRLSYKERVLRDALKNVYNATAPDRGLTMHETTQIYCIAREALKQESEYHD